jgi:hypothetical protein
MSSGVELLVFPIGLLAMAAVRAGGSAVNAAAARQQRRIEARARADRALVEYDVLRGRVEEARQRFGSAITPMPELDRRGLDSTDAETAGIALRRLTDLVAGADARLRQEAAYAGTAALLAGLEAGLRTAAGGLDAAAGARSAASAPAAPDRRSPAETVRRVFERLDPTVTPAIRIELESRAANVLTAAPGRATLLADDLRDGVQQANDAVAVRRARLVDLHERLDRHSRHAVQAGPGRDALDGARRLLLAAGDDPDPDWPSLTAAVDQAVDRTVAAALRAYAATSVREALQEVGCEVEEDFDVLLVEDGVAHLRRPGWTDLAVRVRQADAESGQSLRFSLVAPKDTAVSLDAGTETRWCDTVDELLPALSSRGLGADVVERSKAGEGYVQPVERARFPFSADTDENAEPAVRRRAPERREQRRAARP